MAKTFAEQINLYISLYSRLSWEVFVISFQFQIEFHYSQLAIFISSGKMSQTSVENCHQAFTVIKKLPKKEQLITSSQRSSTS